MERVCHLTNKIYREMLCITRDEKMTIITMGGLNQAQFELIPFSPTPPQISWDLLAWISVEGRIPCSFNNFITTPESSGSFYVSPDIYHTQVTEYSLESIYLHNYFQWALFSLHLSIFLIVILLDPPHLLFTIALSIWTGPLGKTFPVRFQLKWFFIYSDQFLHNALYVITPQNWCVIHWKLLLSGFKWVLVIVTDKPLRLNTRLVSRDLVPSDRATCTIASRVNLFATKKLSLKFDFKAWDSSISPLCKQCNYIYNNAPKHLYDCRCTPTFPSLSQDDNSEMRQLPMLYVKRLQNIQRTICL